MYRVKLGGDIFFTQLTSGSLEPWKEEEGIRKRAGE